MSALRSQHINGNSIASLQDIFPPIMGINPDNLTTITPMPSITQQLWKEEEIMGR